MRMQLFCRLLLALLPLTTFTGCENPQPRPGLPFEGSARWAWNVAQPMVAAFSTDAQLYDILGASVFPDGRLPANVGDWSFVTWSASQHQRFQVTVNFDGSATSSTTNAAKAPGVAGTPVPANWVNSTVIFQTTVGHRARGVTITNLAMLNGASYPTAPGANVWAINFDTPPNQLVRWDGTYLGAE
ncbi:MAG: hypothetical protein ACRD3L_00910 [Terriglobales bacterium]